jgi:hypothetical protein
MASPARRSDRAGKIQLPAVQGWGAEQAKKTLDAMVEVMTAE